MALTVLDIIQLYRSAGAVRYGMESVSQEQHALQCAVLAEQAGSPPELVAAALLHDLGHLVRCKPDSSAAARDDFYSLDAQNALTRAVEFPPLRRPPVGALDVDLLGLVVDAGHDRT